MDFPKIKNLRWVSKDCLDLVQVSMNLVKLEHKNLDIPGLKPDELTSIYTLDLSKLAGVRPYYPTKDDEPSSTECLVDFEGVDTFVINVTEEDMIKVWLFYKKQKHATKDI